MKTKRINDLSTLEKRMNKAAEVEKERLEAFYLQIIAEVQADKDSALSSLKIEFQEERSAIADKVEQLFQSYKIESMRLLKEKEQEVI